MACNNQGSGATVNDSTSADTLVMVHADTAAAIVTPSCYALQTSNNLILLQLNTVRPTVSGHLTYDIMGKDKNDGTISGILRGDTLLADYNFISGGKHFVRQVAFLRKGDAFVEGYGDLKQQGDRTVFANTDTLDFNGAMILEKVPCTR
jgi:hypothetical protein